MAPASGRGPRLFLAGVDLSIPTPLPRHFELPDYDSHHIRDVLRLGIGDPVEIADAEHALAVRASITALYPVVSAESREAPFSTAPKGPEIHLLFALCKGQKNDLVCDWATELGCTSLIFWQAERSVVRLKNDAESGAKTERFLKIARAAAQQSRQAGPPVVKVTRSLPSALESVPRHPNDLAVWGCLGPDSIPFPSLSSDIQNARSVHLLLGPEGDLSPMEENFLRAQGYRPISLGERVLRAELAVVTAIVSLRAAVCQ